MGGSGCVSSHPCCFTQGTEPPLSVTQWTGRVWVVWRRELIILDPVGPQTSAPQYTDCATAAL